MTMTKHRPAIICLCSLVTLATGCKASDEDCEKLGSKFVELFEAEQSEDTPLSPKIIENAAVAGKKEVVEKCKANRPAKASVDRCLEATTMAELRSC